MMALGLALAWAVLVLSVSWRHRPPPRRLRHLGPDRRRGRRRTVRSAPAGQVGSLVSGRRVPPDDPRATRLGRAVVAAVVALVATPLAAPAVGLLVWAAPVLTERGRRQRREAAIVRELPEVVDLLVLAVGAGLTVPLAVAAVARRCSGPVGLALAHAARDAAMGRRIADALDDLPAALGEPVRPLVAALVASDRYGAPLLEGLDRLAGEVRHARRRRAEEAARKVPVKLLFPLVCCTLPAFALLTVAPLIAGGLRSLRL